MLLNRGVVPVPVPDVGLPPKELAGGGVGLTCTPCSEGTYGLMEGSRAVVLRVDSADSGDLKSEGEWTAADDGDVCA